VLRAEPEGRSVLTSRPKGGVLVKQLFVQDVDERLIVEVPA
jgi:hypothetical protein